MLQRQLPQSRLALAAINLHAWACTLSKLDRDIRKNGSTGDEEFARDKAAALHFFDIAELEIEIVLPRRLPQRGRHDGSRQPRQP